MPNRFEARPVRSIAAILAALVLVAEAGLRLVNFQALDFAHEARQVHRYSRRWRVDLVADSTAHLRIADRKRGGDLLNFILSTNADGFRAPARLRDRLAPGPGARFIHAIGDSYSMGWGVAYEASYPAQLDELLGPPFRVLNLGVDGYGTIAATRKSMELASRYPPAATVYLFSPNDFDDDRQALAVSRRSALRHRAAEALDALRRLSYLANVPFALRWWLFFDGSGNGEDTARGPDPRLLVSTDPTIDRDPATLPPPDPANPSLAQLAAYARFLEARGAPLLVLALSTQPESLACYRFCRDHGIESRLVEVPLPLRLSGEGHFSPLGNEQIARFVRGELARLLDIRANSRP
jgi:hypothetical protein